MSYEASITEELQTGQTEVLFKNEIDVSSEEPMEEWSSLILATQEDNVKRMLHSKGLYDPGSGEICVKYIAQSDSTVLRHPYFSYPAVVNPGILEALQEPEEVVVYPDDGQVLYLAICKKMNQCPVRIFHRNLLNENIDLRYYCVNPNGVRAMGMALQYNKTVKTFNLTDSYLNNDACYHLGHMLRTNSFLYELNLSGCKIGPDGARRLFAGLPDNKTLRVVNLSKNELGDSGGELLAESVFRGIFVQQWYLSYNNLGSKTGIALTDAFETHNKFTHLDLSWNNFYTPTVTFALLSRLSENENFQQLNLSYNSLSGPRIGSAIAKILSASNLRHLDISNNKLRGDAVTNLLKALHKPKKLVSLNLSFNPLTPGDALAVIEKMTKPLVKLQELIMDNISVDAAFLDTLNAVKMMKFRKKFVISYGYVISSFKPKGPDIRDVLLNRADYLAKKPKKNPVDIALIVLKLLKDSNNFIMEIKAFMRAVKNAGAPLDDDLLNTMISTFPGPIVDKNKTIDVARLGDFIKRKWPDRKLPPTPPPEPVETEPVTKKGKGKKK